MQQGDPNQSTAKGKRRRPKEHGARSPTYASRMKAAGFSPDDEPPQNVHRMRNAMARRIAMFINTWRGCPEPICRRHRGCMAPHIRCANAPRTALSAEESARVRAQVSRALQQASARLGEGA